MAISIISGPNQWQAAYNPIKWVLNSTNKNQPGFRYIVQIIDSVTSQLVNEQLVIPDPINSGYGIIDVSRIVQNKVDKFLGLTSSVVNDAVNTYWRYNISFGESYVSSWTFNDYIFLDGDVGLTTDQVYDPLFSNATHSYVVGDQVYVNISSLGDCRDAVRGYFTVTEVPSNKTIKINLGFPCSGPVTPGTVIYADRRKSRFLNLLVESNRGVINASHDIKEFSTTTGSMASYEITSSSTNAKLLTNVPYGFRVSPVQHLWLNQFENTNGTVDNVDIRFINSNGDVFRKTNSGNFTVKQTSIGPGNLGSLTLVSGTTPLIKPNTEWYDIWLMNDSGVRVSEIKRFTIDWRCPINNIEIIFMDRKGSFMSYYFPLNKSESIETSKEMYDRYLYEMNTSSDAVITYYSKYEKSIELSTNFLNDEEHLYFEELLTSPYTYIRLGNDWYSCKVMPGSFVTPNKRVKRLEKRKISVKLDLNTPINI
jgi:hypothetical protein